MVTLQQARQPGQLLGRQALGGRVIGPVLVVIEYDLQGIVRLLRQADATDPAIARRRGSTDQAEVLEIVHQLGDRALGHPQASLQLRRRQRALLRQAEYAQQQQLAALQPMPLGGFLQRALNVTPHQQQTHGHRIDVGILPRPDLPPAPCLQLDRIRGLVPRNAGLEWNR
ncbi:hypothetical protein D3C78_1413990 [compost metagenome]